MTHGQCYVAYFLISPAYIEQLSFPLTFITGLAHKRQPRGSLRFHKNSFFDSLYCQQQPCISLMIMINHLSKCSDPLLANIMQLDTGLLLQETQSLHHPCSTAEITDRWPLPHLYPSSLDHTHLARTQLLSVFFKVLINQRCLLKYLQYKDMTSLICF